ncbi:transposase [Paenibacillus sp. RC73]
MLRRHEIQDADWERIQDLLPPENRGEGRPSKPNRVVINGIICKNKNRRSLA